MIFSNPLNIVLTTQKGIDIDCQTVYPVSFYDLLEKWSFALRPASPEQALQKAYEGLMNADSLWIVHNWVITTYLAVFIIRNIEQEFHTRGWDDKVPLCRIILSEGLDVEWMPKSHWKKKTIPLEKASLALLPHELESEKISPVAQHVEEALKKITVAPKRESR